MFKKAGRKNGVEIENIYFVQNFHGIQYFLSLYQPEASNLIVMSDVAELQNFLDKIMPGERKIIVPRIPDGIHPVKLPLYYLYWRKHYSKLLKYIKPTATVYFFSKSCDIHFFALLGYLSRRRFAIKHVDAIGAVGAKCYEEEIKDLKLYQLIYMRILSFAAGVRLVRIRARLWEHFGLKEAFDTVSYGPDSWGLIARKYNWPQFNKSEIAVLLVDLQIQRRPGINLEVTQQNLVRFFGRLLDEGKEIHVKLKYGAEISSLHGTLLAGRLKILAGNFPVELIMDQYKQVYMFVTIAGATPIKGKKYSLMNMIVWNSMEEKNIFMEICKDDFYSEMHNIEFVDTLI